MTKNLFFTPLVSLAYWLFATAPTAAAIERKMVTERVATGSRRLVAANSAAESSAYAALIGHCSPGSPFSFPVSAGEGKGMIGLMDNTHVLVTLDFDAGQVELDPLKQANVFSVMYVFLLALIFAFAMMFTELVRVDSLCV